jgi:uncharacterized protein YjbJ (UPF0337 family)
MNGSGFAPCWAWRRNADGDFLFHSEAFVMSGKKDEIVGRIKEATGAITDDDKLRREGKTDQTAGKVKQAVDKAADKAKDAIDRAKDAALGN